VTLVPFCVPDIDEQDKQGVMDVLSSQWLTGGNKTIEFEEKFASYVGTKYVISVNSCTAALHLIMIGLHIGIGDEVIVPTLTFAATANAPVFCGAKPVFADIDVNTLNISPESIVEKITPKTKAIIVVHLAGNPCDMDAIRKIAKDYKLYLVEDCAHSLGATYRHIQTGNMSNAGAFSFYPTKPMTTGEGGIVVTNDEELYKEMKLMRSHFMTKEAFERSEFGNWRYDVAGLGYNYRMSEISASLGITQLDKLNWMNDKRDWIVRYYNRELKVKGIIKPYRIKNTTSSDHLYIIRVTKEFGMNRDALIKKLAERGIECSVHYTPLHLMSFYQKEYGYKYGDYTVAENVYNEILSLPIYSKMNINQAEYVVNSIKELAK
jgi:dTDP-4-amino-4,6-dideoxygalactose transaminase